MKIERNSLIGSTLFVVAILGVMFQVGHFAEHAWQFGEWLFSTRTKPWMSDAGMWLTMMLGELVYPMPDICGDEKAWMAQQMKLGMEVLHVVGNSIFLVTIACLLYFMPNKWVKAAFAVEAFHLYEHIMLTTSLIYLGKPVGLSTLFGATGEFRKENMVGFRVGWHFFMNLIPSTLIMIGMMKARMGSMLVNKRAHSGR